MKKTNIKVVLKPKDGKYHKHPADSKVVLKPEGINAIGSPGFIKAQAQELANLFDTAILSCGGFDKTFYPKYGSKKGGDHEHTNTRAAK